MAPRKFDNLYVALENGDALSKAIEDSDKYLVVVNVHQEWCGPCTVVEPIFKRVMLEKDNIQVKFLTIAVNLMNEAEKAAVPHPESSKPFFLIYRNKVVIGKVAGVNAPELETLIIDNAPVAVDEEN